MSRIRSLRWCRAPFRPMNSGRYLLSQVLDLVDRKTLSRLVERYDAEYRVRPFGCRQQLICMTFVQLIAQARPESVGKAQAPAVEKELGYFVNNVERMQYGTVRRQGFFIYNSSVRRFKPHPHARREGFRRGGRSAWILATAPTTSASWMPPARSTATAETRRGGMGSDPRGWFFGTDELKEELLAQASERVRAQHYGAQRQESEGGRKRSDWCAGNWRNWAGRRRNWAGGARVTRARCASPGDCARRRR